ncbi:hypothetical protein EXM22_03900 [Oceanispirochaeta crateris]|uniref:6-bladed beta-propeller n=1 Tax=Oceanispirochaeta crateris TaxID=2518645 RepID=A0A5C1QLY7_9SPIO|nr:hypothetical protein [Oceanispirochaeta crateris]QEN07172.1 hypothetical protein EXM22_03900 [Oceanispirochaeta crateris]
MKQKYLTRFLIISLLFILFSCNSENKVLQREDLFILPMGYMADELNYFLKPDSQLPGSSDLFINDGRVFLSSSNAGKIMELNSYGDLLGFYYNPTINPEPAQYITEEKENPVMVKKWNFRGIEHLAVTDEYLLVADRVDENQSKMENKILHNRIVLRFNHKGEFIDYLGQEGIQGAPFAFIQGLEVTDSGEIVVMTRQGQNQLVYWYSQKGELLYKIILDKQNLPIMEEDGWSPGVPESIKPDRQEHKLYIKMDYFPLIDSPDLKSVSRLYTLDLTEERYTGYFTIANLEVELNGQKMDGIYEYLGITSSGLHFFLGSDFSGRYYLIFMDQTGAVKVSRVMFIQDSGILFRRFFLSAEGLLAGIFYEENGARVSWWRTDKIAEKYAQ